MNIRNASEKTGLTKRAIKYYEDEGLICPSKNFDNNYREYSDRDIVKLNLIGALRAIDIPVGEIKNVVNGEKGVLDVMKDALQKINENIDDLQKSKMIIQNIIEKKLDDYNTAGDYIIILRETLELSTDGKKELISTILLRKFPGKFGKVFVALYAPFLNVSIDNEEKNSIWLKLVELIDDVAEMDEGSRLIKWYEDNGCSDADLEKIKKARKSEIEKNLSQGVDKESVARWCTGFIQSINDSEYKGLYNQMADLVVDKYKAIGSMQKKFSEYLSLLNKEYKNYIDYMNEYSKCLDEEMIKQTGYSSKEFLRQHDVKIAEDMINGNNFQNFL